MKIEIKHTHTGSEILVDSIYTWEQAKAHIEEVWDDTDKEFYEYLQAIIWLGNTIEKKGI